MKTTSICLTCNKQFLHYPSQKRKYCSSECVPVNIGNTSRWKGKIPVKFTCMICTTEFSVRPSRAAKGNVKYCSFTCHQIGEGRKGGELRGEQMKEQSQHKAYPKIKGRHAHRVIAEQKLGRPLLSGEVVHHIDENKQNYSEDNLMILSSQSDHARIHIYDMLRRREENKHGK